MVARFILLSLLWVVCALLAGCGDKMARVEGTVTFNGEPVSRGQISLEPTDGKGSIYGANLEDGKFVIEGVLPGEKIVRISAAYTKSIQKDADGSEIEICDDLLPAEYAQNSKERLNVEAPLTKKDYAITGPDPRKKK